MRPRRAAAIGAGLVLAGSLAQAQDVEFKGKIAKSYQESRGAVALGLERDDTIIRTGLWQKMELLDGAAALDLDLSVGLGAFQDVGETAGTGQPQDEGDLARAVQNPVADLISLPLQNNINFGAGSFNHVQNVLNIQPVIPVSLNDDWNLITRTIVPLIYQPSLFAGDDHDFGLGDVQFTGFFSPKEPVNGWILGGGPTFRFPTATDARLGARKWAIGPSAVVLRMDGPWVYGGLFQNVWSIAGSGDRNVNELLIQPFVNYNLSDGWYLTSSPVITANWQADSDDEWTVPIGGGVGRIFQIGDQPVNLQVQGFYNVEKPDLGPEWTLRLQLQLLFPQ